MKSKVIRNICYITNLITVINLFPATKQIKTAAINPLYYMEIGIALIFSFNIFFCFPVSDCLILRRPSRARHQGGEADGRRPLHLHRRKLHRPGHGLGLPRGQLGVRDLREVDTALHFADDTFAVVAVYDSMKNKTKKEKKKNHRKSSREANQFLVLGRKL